MRASGNGGTERAAPVGLSTEEREELRRALEWYLTELRAEILKTDSAEWRAGLKRQKEILLGVVRRL